MKWLITICTIVVLMLITTNPAHAVIRNVPSDYPKIQDAINASVNGDEVVVADGTYTGIGNRDIDFKGKAITVRSQNGFVNCAIDCQGTQSDPHRGFKFISGETTASVLDGFTITNGYGPHFAFEYTGLVGGGILCDGSSPTIKNCIITSNTAETVGGILLANSSNAELFNCTISNNRSLSAAGGVLCINSNSIFENYICDSLNVWFTFIKLITNIFVF